ncbi:MAG: hypothetical protein M3M85_03175 [bacterium]|nr:hypothetical protein [bacterium]
MNALIRRALKALVPVAALPQRASTERLSEDSSAWTITSEVVEHLREFCRQRRLLMVLFPEWQKLTEADFDVSRLLHFRQSDYLKREDVIEIVRACLSYLRGPLFLSPYQRLDERGQDALCFAEIGSGQFSHLPYDSEFEKEFGPKIGKILAAHKLQYSAFHPFLDKIRFLTLKMVNSWDLSGNELAVFRRWDQTIDVADQLTNHFYGVGWTEDNYLAAFDYLVGLPLSMLALMARGETLPFFQKESSSRWIQMPVPNWEQTDAFLFNPEGVVASINMQAFLNSLPAYRNGKVSL